MIDPPPIPEKAKLKEINQYLTCYLCKGYLVDATTISECLHSFCRSCIIKFLEDNSHCPVCELIINKAKPNLKLDKTLQDIVYKLIPDLFLKEMIRRKLFYQHYPQLAVRVSPEERGEDTERTIFNAQEKISLSLEYICDDSSPGAIRLPGLIKLEASKTSDGLQNDAEDTQMKRYLLCPGMCRIDVLKKFVRNKYNVDTSEFYIDILYKRIPLPDHYTLIDVAYIYSWQRNETMKFFFRIIDINKAPNRFDFFDASQLTPQLLSKPLVRTKSVSEKNSPATRKESVSSRKSVSKMSLIKSVSPEREHNGVNTKCDKISSENCPKSEKSDKNLVKSEDFPIKSDKSSEISIKTSSISDKLDKNKTLVKAENSFLVSLNENNNNKENNCTNVKSSNTNDTNKDQAIPCSEISSNSDEKEYSVPINAKINIKKERLSDQFKTSDAEESLDTNISKLEASKHETKVPIVEINTQNIKSEPKSPVKDKSKSPETKSRKSPKSKVASPKRRKDSPKLKLKIFVQEPKSDIEDPYNFESNEVFEQQNNKESTNIICKPNCYTKITLNRTNNVEIITKVHTLSLDSKNELITNTLQTVKKATKIKGSPKNSTIKKSGTKVSKILKVPKIILSKSVSNGKKDFRISPIKSEEQKFSKVNEQVEVEDEKSKFLKSFDLQAKSTINNIKKTDTPKISENSYTPFNEIRPSGGQKRKNSSPMKTKKAKISKVDNEISLEKSQTPNNDEKKPGKPVTIILQQRSRSGLDKQDPGLQSLINNCKIPSSLSITIKESSEQTIHTPVAPPVKNFIEILKISDDGSRKSETQTMDKPIELPKMSDDTEKQVDQDLNDIAKSLTEKIPMSTTISHIIGPKQSFSIPIKSTMPKINIQPAPVPELSKVLIETPKQSTDPTKLTNSFQKAFEESIKSGGDGKSTPNKRSLLKGNIQTLKKPKNDEKIDKPPVRREEVPLPKVAIPRLPHQRNIKFPISHANNTLVPRTIANLHSSSLGMNYTVSVGQTSPSKTNKVNGTLSPEKLDTKLEFKLPSSSEGLKNSPKNSPKSSPVVKHMFSSQKLANISPKPPGMIPSGSMSPKSPSFNQPTTPDANNATIAINPNEILEKYNLQNIAQLTATFNFNPAALALSQTNQIAAFQQAMLLKQFEMQNRQNWLVRNQGPLLQYENYLKSLSGVKEN